MAVSRWQLDQDFPGIYVSETEPPADYRDRVWFIPTAGKFYNYISGQWQRTYDEPALSPRLMPWYGSDAALSAYGRDVTDGLGAFWEPATQMDGRVPIGIGTIPTSSPAAAVTAVGDTTDTLGSSGEYKHVLTEAEGSVGQHVHPFGRTNPASDDAFFAKTGINTVPSYSGFYITGSDALNVVTQTTADLVTLPPGLTGAGVTAVGHYNLQPFIGIRWAKRTSRTIVLPPY